MNATLFFRLIFLAATLAVGLSAARAEEREAVKARMEQRQGTVDALKDRKVVGENNRGFLEPRGTLSAADQKVVSDENADRSTVYAAIAAKAGVSADQVGRARAQKISVNSKPGIWLQAPDGSWSEKK
ncbi:YdbL family protein [Opitutus sp. ER46]|uniref:YdbL family protein n=1 Tax=Opitutus sp. ER46 TaxID=2161864 RepID=UPI000D317D59|nr:YdbL family protein [Opitutus sp. ER46]PTX90747.1 DUF1318 domain-containing protein [Opitutus sp. ER46]